MKILIDMSFVSPKTINYSIPILVMRLLKGIPTIERGNFKLLFDKGCAEMLHGMFPDYDYCTVKVYNNRKLYYDPRLILCPFNLKRSIEKSGCDVVFFPCDGNRYALFKSNIKEIVLINDLKWLKHDMLSEKKGFKGLLDRMYSGVRAYKRTIKRASIITTNSEYTKNDLLRFFPETDARKVYVTYLPIPIIENSCKPSGIADDESFILNVNSLLKFKNPITLIKAFSRISNQYKGNLVLVGKSTAYWDNVLVPYIEHKGLINRIVHLQNLKEEELRYLYEHADLFVTPSLHEGFGLTPVEAAIYGCPVLCSKCESLPEVTMGLVHYYTPTLDDNILANEMIKILKAPPPLSSLNNISDVFKKQYSIYKYANHLLKLFNSL